MSDTSKKAEADRAVTRWRRPAAVVAVAVAIGGLGGAAIYAATDQPSGHHASWGGHPPAGQPGPPPGGFGPANADGDAADQALHSEFVTRNGTGSRTTVVQTGTITAVVNPPVSGGPQSITVRSDDGFAQTYAIPAGQPSAFAPDQYVSVRATRDGQTVTVTHISNATRPDGAGLH
ncbi:hypothetical protein [Mycobacterium sp. OTB74]|uniref:hypothetical protein n=1 Tax=Mycobacterium sp. OTB74 TaxID=1853452 RepID=UPI0024772CFC|nr:hypothetical protein [Mycobacterium sp. OTB74]